MATLVQIIAWCQTDDKSLSEAMICFTDAYMRLSASMSQKPPSMNILMELTLTHRSNYRFVMYIFVIDVYRLYVEAPDIAKFLNFVSIHHNKSFCLLFIDEGPTSWITIYIIPRESSAASKGKEESFEVQWNMSVTTTSIIKCIAC